MFKKERKKWNQFKKKNTIKHTSRGWKVVGWLKNKYKDVYRCSHEHQMLPLYVTTQGLPPED